MTDPLRLFGKAERLLSRSQWDAATRLLSIVIRRSTDPFLRAEALYHQAECLRALGDFRRALKGYLFARTRFEGLGVPSEQDRCLLGASMCLRVLGRFRKARSLWGARRGRGPAGNAAREDILLERSLVERGLGNFSAARRSLRAGLAGFRRRGDADGLRHGWWAMGGLERFSGRPRASLSAYRRAERLARSAGDRASAAYALCGQGGTLRVLGEGQASLRAYQRASHIFQRTRDPFGRAYGMCGMANALRTFGDAGPTLGLYRRSADLYRRLGDESSEGFAHWGLGGSLRRLGRRRESRAAYRRALRLFTRSADDRGLVMSRLGVARLEEEENRPRAATRETGRALGLARRRRLPYETALARFENSRRSSPGRPRFSLLSRFGLPASAVRKWRDLP